MRTTDPGLQAIRDALEDYDLTTDPATATTAGRAERIGEYLLSGGYTIRPHRMGVRRFLPRGSDVGLALTYTAAVVSMAASVHLGWVQLWIPAASLIVCAAFFAAQAHHQRLTRRTAAAAESAARPHSLHAATAAQDNAALMTARLHEEQHDA
jgi:hypothetical protein